MAESFKQSGCTSKATAVAWSLIMLLSLTVFSSILPRESLAAISPASAQTPVSAGSSVPAESPVLAESPVPAESPVLAESPVPTESPASAESPEQVTLPPLTSTIQRPRWEVGVGAGYILGYDYPASSDANRRGIALPFFIYRTPLFRVGGGGIRAVAIERPLLKLDLSVGGSLNASSEGNSARQGMPDLDFLFEAGPQLELRWFDRRLPSGARWRSRFTAELRAVFSTDFGSVDSRGFVADFGVGANLDDIAGSKIGLFAGFDVTLASEKLQDYFYEVDPEFVTPTRARYDARGGYLESTLFTGLAYRPLSNLRLFTGLSLGLFNGASNQDSPLFDVTEQLRFALGVVWTIKTSQDMVDIVELGTQQ